VAYWRPMLVEALAAMGRIDDANDVLDRLTADAGRSANVLVRLDLARAKATVLARSGDAPAGGALAADTLLNEGEHAASAPFSRARLALVAGGLLRRAGRRRVAAGLLKDANEIFARLGATPWQERCESELGDAEATPARRGAADAALTRQESAVARLAATGLTNREVAADLVLSTKTVEHHLSRAYAKLGVRSRTELAVRLSAETPASPPDGGD
jgi:DNA-binding CsgD family transcriptional regulator